MWELPLRFNSKPIEKFVNHQRNFVDLLRLGEHSHAIKKGRHITQI